jgi:hypothetical protein
MIFLLLRQLTVTPAKAGAGLTFQNPVSVAKPYPGLRRDDGIWGKVSLQ